MKYEIAWAGDPEDVLITTSGDATVDDLQAMARAVMADPRFREDLTALIDHTDTRWWALSNQDLEARAEGIRADAERLGRQRIAVVVGSPLDFGIGQTVMGLLADGVEFETEIFESRTAARAWLRRDQ